MSRHCNHCPAWVEATYRHGDLVRIEIYHPHGTGAHCAGTRTPEDPADWTPTGYRDHNYANGRLSDPNRPSRATHRPYTNPDPDARLRLSRQSTGFRNLPGRTSTGTKRK